jgi:lysine-N-methylase
LAGDHSTINAPKYMSTFKCVGSACEETCCSSFHVDVDRTTFKAYMAVKEPGLSQDLQRYVKKLREPRSAGSYARIHLTSAGNCPFLDDNKLCSIQNRLGEGALSETCRSYPREAWERDGTRYLGAKLSCPEAARLCVSSPDAMAFPEDRVEHPGDDGLTDAVATHPGGGATVRWAVHAAIEEVTRDRALPVWKAIIFAGVITETYLSDDPTVEPAGSDMLQSIRTYTAETRQALLQEDFAIGDQALVQFKILTGIALSASGKGSAHNRLPKIVKASLDNILGSAEDFDGALTQYAELYENKFKPFDDAHDYALRNFVLNYLYLNRVFLTGPALPQFQNLAVRFGVIRLLLVGLSSARPEGLSIADYAAVVSSASRIMDHDPSVSTEICAALDAVEPRSVSLAVRMVIPPV